MWKTTRNLALRRIPWRLTESIWPPFQGGRWYGPGNEVAQTTLALTANRLYGMPIYVPVTAFCQAIAARITTLAAGSSIRLGIYSDSSGVPGNLLVDAGVVSGAVADEVALALVKWLPAGWYWLACLSDGTPILRDYESSNKFGWLGFTSGKDISEGHAGMTVSRAFGALPNPFTAGAVLGFPPRVLLRAT